MSYLTSEDFESICNTVKIIPISSETLGDISQYSFNCGKAKEYETFLKQKALMLEEIGVTRTFLIIHTLNNELIGYYSLSADTVRLTIDEKSGTDLEKVDFSDPDNRPLIILERKAVDYLQKGDKENHWETTAALKLDHLGELMETNNYNQFFYNEKYAVYY